MITISMLVGKIKEHAIDGCSAKTVINKVNGESIADAFSIKPFDLGTNICFFAGNIWFSKIADLVHFHPEDDSQFIVSHNPSHIGGRISDFHEVLMPVHE